MALITFAPFTKIKSADINANFSGLADGSNDLPANSLQLLRKHNLRNFIPAGLTLSTSANLSTTLITGVAYVNGKYIIVPTQTITFAASKDTYVDIKDDGTVVLIPVANGVTTGFGITVNSDGTPAVRIGKIVTSTSAITLVVQSGKDVLNNWLRPVSSVDDNNYRNGIFFRARRAASLVTTANNQTTNFAFDTVEYNYGNGYDPSTGLFTAPVKGLYEFKVTFYTESATIVRAFFILRGTINANYKTRNYDMDATTHRRMSATYEVFMNASETIGFDIWTGASIDVASAETFLTGHIITRVD